MTRVTPKAILTVLFFFLTLCVFSQEKIKKKKAEEMAILADQEIIRKNYASALSTYSRLVKALPKNDLYKYKEAICETHINGQKEKGIKTLKTYVPKQGKNEFSDIYYHLAEAHYHSYQFEKAQEYYEKYYDQVKESDDAEWIRDVQLHIDQNHNAKLYSKDTAENVKITNIGSPINTSGYEYSPYVTPQEDMMVFTYMGEKSVGGKMDARFKPNKNGTYTEDILISYKKQSGDWGKPISISSVNSDHNESCVGISPSGDRLFIFQSGNGNIGDLYETYIDEAGNWSKINPLKGDVNSKAWEGSATITQDGKTLYFASTRFGGYGGRDIYSATLQENGKWGDITNLGPQINSEYDEDSPFIHPDKKTLYYSTNGTKSMGGYDIVYAEKQNEKWHYMDDLGIPINTIGDDRFYILSADGKTGYFSRESGNETRDQDIYMIHPGNVQNKPVLAIISGKVFLDDKEVDAVLEATVLASGETQGIYKTSQHSKEYTMHLNPELNYKINVMINGESKRLDTLNSEFVQNLVELRHDFYIYTEGFTGKKAQERSLQIDLQKEYNKTTSKDADLIPDHKIINGKDTITYHDMSDVIKKNRIEFYKGHPDVAEADGVSPEILSIAEKTELTDNVEYKKENGFEPEVHSSADDILVTDDKSITPPQRKKLAEVFHPTYNSKDEVFRVQVAAYRKPQNYNWGGKSTYGDVLEVTYDDGITRFTVGGTVHLLEALDLQKKLIAYGVKDAFVVAFRGEQRIPLYELMQRK